MSASTRGIAPKTLAACVAALRAGGVVVIPTDTVYGLACNAFNPMAVARIYELKGRDYRKPLPVLLPSAEDLPLVAAEILPEAQPLIRAYWPGALTLVVKTSPRALSASRGKDTVAVRVPAHGSLRQVLDALGVPIAATSANLSGSKAVTTGAAARKIFKGLVDVIVDDGRCAVGKESTVLDVTRFPFTVVRHGAVSKFDLMKTLNLIS